MFSLRMGTLFTPVKPTQRMGSVSGWGVTRQQSCIATISIQRRSASRRSVSWFSPTLMSKQYSSRRCEQRIKRHLHGTLVALGQMIPAIGERPRSQHLSTFTIPIDIDRPLGLAANTDTTLNLLIALKDDLPYLLRYQTDHVSGKKNPEHYRRGHEDQRAAPDIEITPADTMRTVLQKILCALPGGWRATIFPDRVILYQGNSRV